MRLLPFLLALAVVVACGDSSPSHTDGPPQIDARIVDAPPSTPDATIDAAIDAGPSVSQQIADAIATPDGTGLSLPITGATVTYLKPQVGSVINDPAGFTIQGSQPGPALFVSVDPTTNIPPTSRGDVVSFTITDMGTIGGQRRALAISNYALVMPGANYSALAQELSNAADLITAIADYDSELLDITGTVVENFVSGGSGFSRAGVNTAGMTGVQPNFQLRVATTVRDAIDLVNGCTFTLNDTPMGRFNAATQLAAFTVGDILISGCPAPTVLSAVALSATSVRVNFTRNVLMSSVMADGSQFTFDNGLTAVAAVVSGRSVDITTTAQAGGTTYTVTVAGTVTDLQGSAVAAPNTAMFGGFVTPAVVRINEVNANITGGCDLIELRVVSGGSMAGFRIQERTGGVGELNLTFGNLNVLTNDIVVVHLNSASATCNPNAATQETTSIIQQPSLTFVGNYDTAWDWWNIDTGLVATDNVFTLYDAANAIMDAVFVSNDPAAIATAAATENQAAIVGTANQWSPMMTMYIDAVFRMNAVDDLDATGMAASGTSIQRLDNTDDNNVADWTTGAGTAQTFGLINAGQVPF